MQNWYDILFIDIFDLFPRLIVRVRGVLVGFFRGLHFYKLGSSIKIRGSRYIFLGERVSVGDFCWIEAVTHFAGKRFSPRLELGDGVSLSNFTHISCVSHIRIGDDCLIGSKVYIGDHSHGSTLDISEIFSISPANRPLGDISPIVIGKNSWICDGAVILAGTKLANNSIIGANSVVRLQTDRAAVIAGAPAKVIKYLE